MIKNFKAFLYSYWPSYAATIDWMQGYQHVIGRNELTGSYGQYLLRDVSNNLQCLVIHSIAGQVAFDDLTRINTIHAQLAKTTAAPIYGLILLNDPKLQGHYLECCLLSLARQNYATLFFVNLWDG